MSVYRRERSRGFTMVELMVVIAIIAILVVALAMGFSRMNTHARTKATRALVMKVETACGSFKNAFGFYPPDAVGRSGSGIPWPDGDRCILSTDAGVPSAAPDDYIGILEYLGLANPSGTVDSGSALAFCLLVEKNGGPFITLDQKFLTSQGGDTYQPYLDRNQNGEYDGGSENAGSARDIVEIVDAWGIPLRYLSPAGRNNHDMGELHDRNAVLIYSAGPNGVFGEDDGVDNDGVDGVDQPGELDEDDITNLQAE